MKKSEILASLSRSLDTGKLLSEYPRLGREGLSGLLREAAMALGPVGLEAGKAAAPKGRSSKGVGRLIIHTDGASRGNPGEAGIGALIEDETGHVLVKIARYLGHATNNQAEYAALIDALKAASGLGAREVAVHADSELVVKQVNGEYRVKNPDLRTMHAEVMKLLSRFSGYVVKYIPRASNAEADALANEAIDKRLG